MQRQGDLLLIPTDRPPQGLISLRTTVVQQGEHSHCLEAGQVLRDPEKGELFILVDREVRLVHEEHAPLSLKPGCYKVQRQRQYRPERSLFVQD